MIPRLLFFTATWELQAYQYTQKYLHYQQIYFPEMDYKFNKLNISMWTKLWRIETFRNFTFSNTNNKNMCFSETLNKLKKKFK